MTGLDPAARALLEEARRGVLATIMHDGRARLVPVCFWLAASTDDAGRPLVYSALDEKPKQSADPARLARVRDLLVRPAVTLLVDRWDEDWRRLAWVRLEGTAGLIGPPATADPTGDEHGRAVAGLRARYPQYRAHDLAGRPLVRIAVVRVVAWAAA